MLPAVFPVKIHVANEDALIDQMATMRQWLDRRRVQPTTFRYTFAPSGFVVRVVFLAEAEAVAFAEAFGGQVP